MLKIIFSEAKHNYT